MKIRVVGGGPAGLYFAILMKRSDPGHDLEVIERNRAGDTFGFGVVFSDATISQVEDADETTYRAITDHFVHWDDIDVHYGGEIITSTGHGFAGMSRHTLLRVLQEQAEQLGVVLRFETELADLSDLGPADLIVAADGVNSRLRASFEDVLQPTVDELAGPFAHVVVDEAQELTDAEWQMVLSRCPSRSLTIVGDRAQSRAGFHEGWEERLGRVGLPGVRRASLTVNYRTPEEVMAEAEPVIRAAVPDANVPTSVRRSGIPVHHGSVDELDDVVAACEGIGVVIGAPEFAGTEKVRSLTAGLAKGLEFDLVVIVDADALDPVDRYVAMTRATQRLVLLER